MLWSSFANNTYCLVLSKANAPQLLYRNTMPLTHTIKEIYHEDCRNLHKKMNTVIVKLGEKDSVHYKDKVEFSDGPLDLKTIARIALRLGATPKTKIRYEIRE